MSERAIRPTSIGVSNDLLSMGAFRMDTILRVQLKSRTAHCHSRRQRPSLPIRCVAGALLVLLGAGGRHGAQAGMLLIDNFSKPNPYQFFVVGSGMNPAKELTQSSTGAIGGERDTLVQVVGQAMPSSMVGMIGDYQGNGNDGLSALQVGTDGLARGIVTLQYSGTDTHNTSTSLVNAHGLNGGLGVDLTNGGTNDQFLLEFASSDAQPTVGLDVKITITSPGGKISTVTATAVNSLSVFNMYIPFSGPHGLVGTASLSHVDSITFVFNGVNQAPNVDYEVMMLGTVEPTIPTPEPESEPSC